MIKGLAHVCFTVEDLDASEAFYCGKLGIQAAFDFRNDQGKRFGLYLAVGERSFIELFEGKLDERAAGQSFSHICLEVEDIEATAAALRQAGVEVGKVSLGSDQSYQAWLADPDGNRIELHQYTPKSRQLTYAK